MGPYSNGTNSEGELCGLSANWGRDEPIEQNPGRCTHHKDEPISDSGGGEQEETDSGDSGSGSDSDDSDSTDDEQEADGEATLASRIDATSAAGQSSFAPFVVREDSWAFGGQYLTTADKGRNNYDGPPDEGRATYEIDVPATGVYAVWGRVRGQSNGNTFYVGSGGDLSELEVPIIDSWQWVRWPTDLPLEAGTATLTVVMREDGTDLDSLFVTSDLDATPTLTPSDGDGETDSPDAGGGETAGGSIHGLKRIPEADVVYGEGEYPGDDSDGS